MELRRNFNRFKEPRGFMKILQFVIAIFAFATTAGYKSDFLLAQHKKCNINETIHIKAKFSYSLENMDVYVDGSECQNQTSGYHGKVKLDSKIKHGAQFFVCVGVISFLYCIAAVIYYIVFEDPAKYGPGGTERSMKSFATVDLIVTVILALFWFCASVAWAVAVSDLKDDTDAKKFTSSKFCLDGSCQVTDKAGYGVLTVSLLFGFLSCFLWCANIWFVFKETAWHKEPEASSVTEKPDENIPRQEVP